MGSLLLRVLTALSLTALLLGGCGKSADQEELEALRRQVEQLQSQVERLQLKQPAPEGRIVAPEGLYDHFAEDAARGALAGLVPGDSLEMARERFGPEALSRSWRSEGRQITQYEWKLDGGLLLRANAGPEGLLEKVAVAFDGSQALAMPSLAGLRLGQETFASLQEKFGGALDTNLQLWGARGYYTVAQTTPLPQTNYRLEFVFQMPQGLSRAQLEQIGDAVQRDGNAEILEAYLSDHIPFLIAVETAR